MAKLPRYKMCFLCGKDNPIGLKLTWSVKEDGSVRAEFFPKSEHQGYKGIVHGGIISALLDETMGLPSFVSGKIAMTVNLNITFRKQAKIGGKLIVIGEETGDRGRLIEAKGRVMNENNETIAEGTGTYYVLPDKQQKEVEEYLEFYDG